MLEVATVARHRQQAVRDYVLLLGVCPLVCWTINIVFAGALDRYPDTMLPYASLVLLNVGVNVILAVSLNLINGFTGQFSLGHAGFMAIGAYTSAGLMFYGFGVRPGGGQPLSVVSISHSHLQVSTSGLGTLLAFAITLYVAGLAASVAGLLVGIPSLRLKGDYLAIVTLGFGEIIRVILLNFDALGGARGFSDLEPVADLFWILLVGAAVVIVTWNMVRCTRGLAFKAVRDDEVASEAVGVDTTRYKVTAFVVGAFFAGVAGGLYAHTQTYINPAAFDFVKSIEIVAMVVLGGLGSIGGTIVAAVGLTLLPELLRGAFFPAVVRGWVPDAVWAALPPWRMVIYAAILILVMLIRGRRGAGAGTTS